MRLEGVRHGMRLPPELELAVSKRTDEWAASGGVRRLHAGDATLWTGRDEAKWLDWLDLPCQEIASVPRTRAFADEVKRRGYTHAAVLGMGGSSLCAEVLSRTFPAQAGYPRLAVLDSTDPAEVAAFASRLNIDRTLFIVSSKSGTTLETDLLEAFIFDLT